MPGPYMRHRVAAIASALRIVGASEEEQALQRAEAIRHISRTPNGAASTSSKEGICSSS
jgi:hypothetical protein